MRCNFGSLFDLILMLVLSIMSLVIGGTGLREPGRVRYWFEWLYWKQTQLFLGIPPEHLEKPKEASEEEKSLARYPTGAKIVLGGIFGTMMVLGFMFLVNWFILAVQFLSNCFCGR